MAAEALAFRTHIVYFEVIVSLYVGCFFVGCDENCKAFIDSGFRGVAGVYARLRRRLLLLKTG